MTDQMPIQPRLLTKDQAAAYVGMTRRGYDRLRALGKLPGYVTGMHRIDKVALDAAIDALSPTKAATGPTYEQVFGKRDAEPEVDPLAKWSKEARAARKEARELAAKRAASWVNGG